MMFESIYAIFQITEEQLNAFIELFNLDDVSTFNGRKAGVKKGSVQAELIETTGDFDESLDMLNCSRIF